MIYSRLRSTAGDRDRTGTVDKDRRILSPVRLPVPPLRHRLKNPGLALCEAFVSRAKIIIPYWKMNVKRNFQVFSEMRRLGMREGRKQIETSYFQPNPLTRAFVLVRATNQATLQPNAELRAAHFRSPTPYSRFRASHFALVRAANHAKRKPPSIVQAHFRRLPFV